MKIYNFLPGLIQCMARWERPPGVSDFVENYFQPMNGLIDDVFDDGRTMHGALAELDWKAYRTQILTMDPEREEARLRTHLENVEKLFGFQLEGEVVLFGAFETMDGYARFDGGVHRVYLGVDESHSKSKYLDILEVHELTHVARESRPQIWSGWGLDPKMSHDVFVEVQPVIEHVFGEGFSCAVSELLVPSEETWHYVYQEKEDFERIFENAKSVDQAIHREIAAGKDGDWGNLYHSRSYRPPLPVFTHYLWGWQWARQMIRSRPGGAKDLIQVCSKDLLEEALAFQLSGKFSAHGSHG
jgi:hypothetical protein